MGETSVDYSQNPPALLRCVMLCSGHVQTAPRPSRTDARLASLRAALPGLRLLTDPADLAHYGRDWTRRWTPAPLAIALPATVDEVQAAWF